MPKGLKNIINKVKTIQKKVNSVAKKANQAKNVVDHPLRSAGGFIGSKLGSKRHGESIGKLLGSISGTGDYHVTGNSITKKALISDGNVPQFRGNGRGFRVTHREYLGDIIASSTPGLFERKVYPINPGLFASFPWLSSIATQYDQWKPNGMVICVNSLSSTYSGTSSLGTVAVATDYDVLDAPYASKVEMANSQFATSGNTAQSLIHPIECNVRERPQTLYNTRSAGIPANDSLRFYDFCNVVVATAGCTANQVVGELWITYDITFYKPQLYGGLLGRSILGFNGTATSGISLATPFGNYIVNRSNFTPTITGNVIEFPSNLSQATFLVTYSAIAATSVQAGGPVVYTSGTSPGPNLDTDYYLTSSGTTNIQMMAFTVKLSGSNVPYIVTFTPLLAITGPTSTSLTITQINPFD